ncbi:UDP-N-acetylenolpyruvoylglucosamine reductase [Burkholderia sp. PAMC 28687]|uniref:UDP-N-acetylenolpyruvoylglucosamine reductase n=1 Tax=Caballeronia sordidicola TaxID=196367 RepID=A0A242N258_CABSO|nr:MULTISPECIES: UDP-N-acetylmuramate dehydrogenase [Burkholderiaceae]AMM14785.1 UDP-N-acetylenolpyruvoylglucosamine reductase [Burkholderia sp. PAMC 28687]OTP77755.1 UDP-N-acetylenolpyruvoylglucosamine reductase [Caballeronia sordidicola]
MPEYELLSDYPLLAHNTFGFDVRARLALRLTEEAQIAALAHDKRLKDRARLILGGGSNVVLTKDFDGVALLMELRGRHVIDQDGEAVYVEAAGGENWHEFVAWSLSQGFPGLENLALIPGTVGAAPIQNIGAYGLEMGERFERLRAIELSTGETREFDRNACAFGYRDSYFKREGRGRFVIVSVTFRLPKKWTPRAEYADIARVLERGASDNPQAIFNAVVAVRQAKLPDWRVLGNAGSFFKNPVISAAEFDALKAREPELVSYKQPDGQFKLAAGWLIDQCGWKGRSIGAAAVHDRQALVLVNRGGASGAQIIELADAVKRDIHARFGVELEAEPVCL